MPYCYTLEGNQVHTKTENFTKNAMITFNLPRFYDMAQTRPILAHGIVEKGPCQLCSKQVCASSSFTVLEARRLLSLRRDKVFLSWLQVYNLDERAQITAGKYVHKICLDYQKAHFGWAPRCMPPASHRCMLASQGASTAMSTPAHRARVHSVIP